MSFISKALEKDRGPIDRIAPEGDPDRQPLERRPADWKSVTRESFSISRAPAPRPEREPGRDADLAPTELIAIPDFDQAPGSGISDPTGPGPMTAESEFPSGPRPVPAYPMPVSAAAASAFPYEGTVDEMEYDAPDDEEEEGARRFPPALFAGIFVAAALGAGYWVGQSGATRGGGDIPIAVQTSGGGAPMVVGSTGARASGQPTPLVIRLEMGAGGDSSAAAALPEVDPAALSAEQAQDQLAMDLTAPGAAARPYRMTHNLLRRGYRIEGIFSSDSDPVAIINGETVREGTHFRDVRIKKIGESTVTVIYRDMEFELK